MPTTATKSTILFRSAPNDTGIVLSNSSWARKLDFGTSWNSLRVGIRAYYRHFPTSPNSVALNGNSAGVGPLFGIGLCSGTPITKASAGHWVGARTTGATWLETDQGVQQYIVQFTSLAPAKKVGATFTLGTNFTGSPAIGAGALHATNFFRSMLSVDIIKGSPNYSFRLFFTGNPATTGDITRAQFLTQMEAVTPVLAGYTYTAAQTLAVDEATNGILNSLNVFYERTGPEIELCDIALARLT